MLLFLLLSLVMVVVVVVLHFSAYVNNFARGFIRKRRHIYQVPKEQRTVVSAMRHGGARDLQQICSRVNCC